MALNIKINDLFINAITLAIICCKLLYIGYYPYL